MAKRYKKVSYAKKESSNIVRWLQLLPVYLTVGLLPFMMRVYVYNPNMTRFSWYYAHVEELFVDVFLAYRQWWFVGISAYMFVVVLLRFWHDKKSMQGTVVCIPMAVFAVFSLASAIFSDYPGYAFGGSFEQFENVFVLMGYALIVYYIFLIVQSEEEVQGIIYVLTASTMMLGLIGVLQTFGKDVLKTEFVMNLITPSGLSVGLNSPQSSGTAYMTLYNPNYVGVYVAMLFPLFTVLLLFSRKWKEQLAYAVTIVLLLISLYGSGSKAAFLVIAAEMFVLLVFMRKPILKFWYLVIPAATALVAVFLLVNQARDNEYIERIQSALKLHKTEYALQSIETKDDAIAIVYGGRELFVRAVSDEYSYVFEITDGDENEVPVAWEKDAGAYRLTDERFNGIQIGLSYREGMNCIDITIDGHIWSFTDEYDSSGTYYYLTEKDKFDKLYMADQVVFNDYERILSGRGYIWSVTLPLLKKYIVIGSGADTFVTAFPQQDYLRLWRNGFSEQIMSKPHSLYLQVAVQDGVIAMLGMLAFFVMYLLQSVRLYINSRFESMYERVGVAVMLAVLGFAVMGISNDSNIAVSVVFWAVAGLGVFCNSQVAKSRKTQNTATE